MLHFDARVGLCRLNQIQKAVLRYLWKLFPIDEFISNPEVSFTVLEVVSFLDANVAGIVVDEAFIPHGASQLLCSARADGGSVINRVDEARCGTKANVATHPQKPLLVLGDRMRFRILVHHLEVGGAWVIDDRSTKDRAFHQYHSFLAQHLFNSLENLLGDAVLFPQTAEVEDRGLIGDTPIKRLDSVEAEEAGRIDQHLHYQRI